MRDSPSCCVRDEPEVFSGEISSNESLYNNHRGVVSQNSVDFSNSQLYTLHFILHTSTLSNKTFKLLYNSKVIGAWPAWSVCDQQNFPLRYS